MPFLVVPIYGDLWENMRPWMYFFASIRVFSVVHRGRKLLKINKYETFQHFHFKNLVLNTFSSSINLWRHLREYELLDVLLCQCMGLLKGLEGLKNDQNYQIYDFRTLQMHFHLKKTSFEYIFWQYKFMETFWRI